VTDQLAFDLPSSEAMTRADFLVAASNGLALGLLDDWAAWPGRRLILVGPEGAGKTHLAHVWAADTGAERVAGTALSSRKIDSLSAGPVVLDDADRLAGDPDAEAALFHLLNFMGPGRPSADRAQKRKNPRFGAGFHCSALSR
jgi:chromosomal replication initiation ATPase DnaA